MPLTGDLNKLRELANNLRTLRAELGQRVAQEAGPALTKLVADEFRASADPYGKAWQPLKRERTKNRKARLKQQKRLKRSIPFAHSQQKPLVDDGDMRNSVYARASGATVAIHIPMKYARFHQTGTHTIPARPMLPDGSRGMPEAWKKKLSDTAAKVIKGIMDK